MALVLVGAIGLMFAGCGDDDEDGSDPPARTVPAESLPGPVTTPPPETTAADDEPDPDTVPRTVPDEEQQGDEEPIHSEAVFTGKGGKLTPREVQVPAFIAVRVILRNADGGSYSLEIAGKRLFVGHARRTDELQMDGLLPNKSYDGKSPQGDVRVVASAEPGP